MDKEKIIKGLNCCLQDDCEECPYYEEEACAFECDGTCHRNDMMHDVLELLKSQEPRVMTLEEVNALDWDYCYLEQERLPGKTYRGMLGKYIMTCVTWPSITAAKISQTVDNYGKTWRCWTFKPTKDQREAVPWE